MPTVFTDVSETMTITREEVDFGLEVIARNLSICDADCTK